jgi:hypothetical protein
MLTGLGIVLLAALSAPTATRHDPEEPSGAPNFALLDHRGRSRELARADARLVVLFVTSNGCPVARQSIPTLKDLQKTYRDRGVAIWLVDPAPQDDRASIAKEAEELDVDRLPILHDEAQLVARALAVHHTGEAIAIDTRTRKIVYRGAVDDRVAPGAQRAEAREHFLAKALDEYLAGRPITRPRVPALGCAVTGAPDRPVSYAAEIAPLVLAKCTSCHAGRAELPAFTSHARLQAAAVKLRRVLLERRMPPSAPDPHVGVALAPERSLTAAETQLLWRWLDQSAPGGDGPDPLADAAERSTARWPLGEPRLRVSVPATPFRDELWRTTIRLEPHAGVWIDAVAIAPIDATGLREVIVRVRARDDTGPGTLLLRWEPGAPARPFPRGTGVWIPAGAALAFELHRAPGATQAQAGLELGLYPATAPAAPFERRAFEAQDLTIPAGEPEARTFALYRLPRETLLYELGPHMRQRGAWFKFEALRPDGTRETLLSVPAFDWRAQQEYRLAEPRKLPAGTWLLATGGYDNSARNPANPAPERRLTSGRGEEAFVATFGMVETTPARARPNRGRLAR